MADVFVSYASNDREWVEVFADALSREGWTVWWDRDIPIGQSFHKVIADALSSARSVTVVWSQHSVASSWVLQEADDGIKRSLLFPVRMDDTDIPIGFRLAQAADLRGWKGEREHSGLRALLKSMGNHLGGRREIAMDEAARLIQRFCQLRRVKISSIEPSRVSSSGTTYFTARASDGLGCIYCHATGRYIGEVYYVRKGISYYYHNHIGGPESPLGLPISNEELVEPVGFPTSYFENGYIDWSPKTGEARAIQFAPDGERAIGKSAVV
jgi:hypothetical protein